MMEYNNNILIDNIIGDLARASNDNIAKSNDGLIQLQTLSINSIGWDVFLTFIDNASSVINSSNFLLISRSILWEHYGEYAKQSHYVNMIISIIS